MPRLLFDRGLVGFDFVLSVDVAFDLNDVADTPSARRPFNRNDEVNRLADHLLHRLPARFGSELLEAAERRHDGVGMDGRYPTRVTSVPRLEQGQRSPIANLTHNNAVGTKPHRTLQEPGHVDRSAGVKKNRILGGALDLRGVFENDKPVVRCGSDDLLDDGIRQRRLSSAGSA